MKFDIGDSYKSGSVGVIVTLIRVGVIIVAAEEQYILHILSVCL